MSMIPVSMVRTLVTGSVVSFSIVLYAFLFADVQPCGPGGKPLDGAGACFNGTNTHFKTLLYLALAVWVTTVTVSFVLYMHRIRSLPRGRHTVFQTVMAVLLAVAMIPESQNLPHKPKKRYASLVNLSKQTGENICAFYVLII